MGEIVFLIEEKTCWAKLFC